MMTKPQVVAEAVSMHYVDGSNLSGKWFTTDDNMVSLEPDDVIAFSGAHEDNVLLRIGTSYPAIMVKVTRRDAENIKVK